MIKKIREPKQERSIEKKQKIVQAGYELFSEAGYHNTNTAEIAKRAGVSTGIVYGYFKDKKDILLTVLEIYIFKISSPVLAILDTIKSPVSYPELIPVIIEETVKAHRENSKIHEALHSLAHLDDEVQQRFTDLEDKLTADIVNKLSSCGELIENANERVHLAINIIQSFCHDTIYDKHLYIDYPKMLQIVTQSLVCLFTH